MSGGVAEAPAGVKVSPLAGKPAPATLLIDPARLEREYHCSTQGGDGGRGTSPGSPVFHENRSSKANPKRKTLVRSL